MTEDPTNLRTILNALPGHLFERTWLRANGHGGQKGKRVLYWTHHALRSDENSALDVAIHVAHFLQLPLLVYQGLSEKYRFASDRHHTFILEAARDLQESYAKLGISFAFHLDRCNTRSPRLARLAFSSAVVVTEDFPLEATKQWTDQLAESCSAAVVLVDTACVVPILKSEAERVTGSVMPTTLFASAHRWLYSRPAETLPESSLWDESNWLGACGDWCGGPRVEGALKSGMSLAGRVLGTLHESPLTAIRQTKVKQLSLFNGFAE